MGLAERFKNKIENKDIFQVNNIEKVFENSDIQFISTPINKKITIVHFAHIAVNISH